MPIRGSFQHREWVPFQRMGAFPRYVFKWAAALLNRSLFSIHSNLVPNVSCTECYCKELDPFSSSHLGMALTSMVPGGYGKTNTGCCCRKNGHTQTGLLLGGILQ